ncbi:hypothetical protein OG592_08655 [Streptomyces avidinii]|uniref:hypothetical protein n=1 Tax=Streptomyces avidinii TaxID=1895 RepID=UPI00386A0DA0|nr:hypothetical protein OG592_08655 [Streptomyces avidinii]
MQNLARAVLVLFGVLVAVAACTAYEIGVQRDDPPTLREADVIGVWEGNQGARIEFMPEGRARLTDARAWTCTPDRKPGVLTAEGSWTLDRRPDEAPGALVLFAVDGLPTKGCADWFEIPRSGRSAEGEFRSGAFAGQWGGGGERYRRAATG